ncbi:MAG: methyltransferase domain-containing protein [Burkholderiales bacterium]|nr:methyltransferase domain-containing protein [Phycisphaerae bacterium]
MTEVLAKSSSRYVGDDYANRHPDWHVGDAPLKADDLVPATLAVARAVGKPVISAADVGGGVGGVMKEIRDRLNSAMPQTTFKPVIYEFASAAVAMGQSMFPDIEFRQKLLDGTDGPHDVIYLVDVLEHLEDPWSLLRSCHSVAPYLIVRQPLLDNFARFHHNDYKIQRDDWGHIAFFNARSFNDMLAACGWAPFSAKLIAPWELTGVDKEKFAWLRLKKMLIQYNRPIMSFFVDGFYNVGAYARRTDNQTNGQVNA